jgi:hypothetical protein
MFCDYFFTQFVRAVVRKQILDGVKNLNDSTEKNDTTIFHLYSKAAGHSVVCEKNEEKLKSWMLLRQLLTTD